MSDKDVKALIAAVDRLTFAVVLRTVDHDYGFSKAVEQAAERFTIIDKRRPYDKPRKK